MLIVDQIGNTIEWDGQPMAKIVSLVPSQTELLHDLGLHEQVIGITKFCIHPKSWHSTKTRIGGTKNVNIEIIRTLQPDLVIANKEENVQFDIETIQKFAQVYVSDIKCIADNREMINHIGELTGTQEQASQIINSIQKEFTSIPEYAPLRTLYLIWRAPYMAAGNDTFIHHLMECASLENIIQKGRYPELSLADIQELAPVVVLLSSEPYPFKQKHIEELQHLLPKAKILLVDGELFSWYGSRIRLTPAYIKQLRKNISELTH